MALRCTEILLAEHREVEKVLAELEVLIDEFLTTPEVPPESLRALARAAEFLDRDLVLHIQKEDDGMFPALQCFFPMGAGPLVVMRDEHEQATESFRGFQEGLAHLKCCPATDKFGAAQVRDHGRALIRVLREHLFKEERILFPFAEAQLSPEGDRQIVQKFEEIVARFPAAPPARLSA